MAESLSGRPWQTTQFFLCVGARNEVRGRHRRKIAYRCLFLNALSQRGASDPGFKRQWLVGRGRWAKSTCEITDDKQGNNYEAYNDSHYEFHPRSVSP